MNQVAQLVSKAVNSATKETNALSHNMYEPNNVKVSSNSSSLDLSSVRQANKFTLSISKTGVEVETIYTAYTSSQFQRNSTLEIGSFSDDLSNFLSGVQGGVSRAMIKGITEHVGAGSWSCMFDSPINPYLQKTGRYEFTINTILPFLYDVADGSVGVAFTEKVLKPIQTLYDVSMPTPSQSLPKDAIAFINNALDSWANWLEDGHKDNLFFSGASGGVRGLKSYTKGLVMLENPLQLQGDVELTATIGPMRYPKVLIKGLDVKFGKMLYTDAEGNVYPTHAEVNISFTSKYRDRADTLIFQGCKNEKLSKFK